MATRADGLFAVMNMGLVAATGRHTANDADVVFHEFTHGVSNRLVGGMRDANALEEPQSGAMGEGWSDYFALTLRNVAREDERTVTGNVGGEQLQGYSAASLRLGVPGQVRRTSAWAADRSPAPPTCRTTRSTPSERSGARR